MGFSTMGINRNAFIGKIFNNLNLGNLSLCIEK